MRLEGCSPLLVWGCVTQGKGVPDHQLLPGADYLVHSFCCHAFTRFLVRHTLCPSRLLLLHNCCSPTTAEALLPAVHHATIHTHGMGTHDAGKLWVPRLHHARWRKLGSRTRTTTIDALPKIRNWHHSVHSKHPWEHLVQLSLAAGCNSCQCHPPAVADLQYFASLGHQHTPASELHHGVRCATCRAP